jgi:Na(+)-translocating NADH:ubiquinone oxidoreductase A subunit
MLLEERIASEDVRIISGGVLTGSPVEPAQLGLGAECDGLTVIPEHPGREFLEFARPGIDRSSFSNCYMSLIRGAFRERFTTAMRGERRPCISCNFCEEICPARIMPHLTHKHLYQDALEEAMRTRADLCVGCGLCSFVCPSKIDLAKQFEDFLYLARSFMIAGTETRVSYSQRRR